jgi:hypothetical protein
VKEVLRETWGTSLELGRRALQTVQPEVDADRVVALFTAHDLRVLDRQQAVFHDRAALIALSKDARAELEDILQGDAQLHLAADPQGNTEAPKTVPDGAA